MDSQKQINEVDCAISGTSGSRRNVLRQHVEQELHIALLLSLQKDSNA